MCFAAGWNGFAGRIWPAGRSLKIPDINYEEEWWQHTPLSDSTPSVNGCDLTLSTQIETSEQEYNDLTASNRRPSTPYFGNTHESLSRWTRSYTFSRSTKRVYMSLACSQDFSKNCWRVEFFYCATAMTKTALCIIQLWFNYIAACFHKAFGVYFAGRLTYAYRKAFAGGWKKFALKLTVCPKNKQFALKITFLFNPNGAWNLL